MQKQHFVKVREDGQRFVVYWFIVEPTRAYGGDIIGIQQSRCNAMEVAYSVAQRHGTTVVMHQA